jgi:hypothetical protein
MTSQILERRFSITEDEALPGPGAKTLLFYRSIASMPLPEAEAELLREIRHELDLPGLGGRRRVVDRMRALLALSTEEARRVASAIQRVREARLPLERLDLEEMERDAALNGLRFEEFRRLRALLPSLKGLEPAVKDGAGLPPQVLSFAVAMAGD